MMPGSLLIHACERLLADYGLVPVVGAELECYVPLDDMNQAGMDAFWRPVKEQVDAQGVRLLRIEKERGDHQYELVFGQYDAPVKLASDIAMVRALVCEAGKKQASFAARPYVSEPSSGLHIHLHLKDVNGDNVFLKSDEYISPALYHALGGLCALTPYVMAILCPHEEGFARYHGGGDHIARNVSWGSNNRSCAIRIPYSPVIDDKRIEWRVPCADAQAEQVLALMLHGVAVGIAQRMDPPEQYHGVATHDARLELLARDMHEAIAAMHALPEAFLPLDASMLERWRGL